MFKPTAFFVAFFFSTAAAASPESDAKYLAKEDVKKELRDPASAVFGTVKAVPLGKNHIACGYVNSKNGFGGMTGMKEFIWAPPGKVFMAGRDDIGPVWNKFCTK